jgi:NADP-dependent alcohol dehydrogenase
MKKDILLHHLVYPKFAVLDSSVMSTLDDRQLANGLVDAFVHTCEQYLTYPNTSLLHDGYAQTILKGLQTLSSRLENRKMNYGKKILCF